MPNISPYIKGSGGQTQYRSYVHTSPYSKVSRGQSQHENINTELMFTLARLQFASQVTQQCIRIEWGSATPPGGENAQHFTLHQGMRGSDSAETQHETMNTWVVFTLACLRLASELNTQQCIRIELCGVCYIGMLRIAHR